MSSISEALAGKNIAIQGQTSNPGVLNAWLRTHHGYDPDDDLHVISRPRKKKKKDDERGRRRRRVINTKKRTRRRRRKKEEEEKRKKRRRK